MATEAQLQLLLSIVVLLALLPMFGGAAVIGLNYNKNSENLPSAVESVSLMKSCNFTSIRLDEPDPSMLSALRDSNISVIVGIPNNELTPMAASYATAQKWVQTNILPYSSSVKFKYITVGSSAITPDDAPIVLFSMFNLNKVLAATGLNRTIKVSTTVDANTVLSSSWNSTPRNAEFNTSAKSYMTAITWFLALQNAPLMANIYTYRKYIANPEDSSLAYAMLKPEASKIKDGDLTYSNLFDATVDSLYVAMEKVGITSVRVVVSETGWPSAGSNSAAIMANAETYTTNVMQRLKSGHGTPLRPDMEMEAHFFMYTANDLGTGETEFGLFNNNNKPVFKFPVV